jgi:hypothetical protein
MIQRQRGDAHFDGSGQQCLDHVFGGNAAQLQIDVRIRLISCVRRCDQSKRARH